MSDDVSAAELHRRVKRLEIEKANDTALRLIAEGLNDRIKRVEQAQVWAFRTVTASALAVIGQAAVVIFLVVLGLK